MNKFIILLTLFNLLSLTDGLTTIIDILHYAPWRVLTHNEKRLMSNGILTFDSQFEDYKIKIGNIQKQHGQNYPSNVIHWDTPVDYYLSKSDLVEDSWFWGYWSNDETRQVEFDIDVFNDGEVKHFDFKYMFNSNVLYLRGRSKYSSLYNRMTITSDNIGGWHWKFYNVYFISSTRFVAYGMSGIYDSLTPNWFPTRDDFNPNSNFIETTHYMMHSNNYYVFDIIV